MISLHRGLTGWTLPRTKSFQLAFSTLCHDCKHPDEHLWRTLLHTTPFQLGTTAYRVFLSLALPRTASLPLGTTAYCVFTWQLYRATACYLYISVYGNICTQSSPQQLRAVHTSPQLSRAVHSSPEHLQAAQSSPVWPRAAPGSPDKPGTSQISLYQPRATQSNPEQPGAIRPSRSSPRIEFQKVGKVGKP